MDWSKKPRWDELEGWQKGGILLLALIQITLLLTALRDLRSRPASAVHGDKRWWTAVVFVNIIGPIVYFIFGRKSS